ncbi:MAG: YhbY family RNA-binding protein [Deltaproteobacteria bacterium]|nr:YhbY family RNA-binding protein [Deltaproteobacteria bacterium]
MPLTRDQIRKLRGESHSLPPVVRIGNAGLSEGVMLAIDDALEAHELVKIRMLTDDRDARKAWMAEIIERTRSEKIHSIGKMLTIWRKRPPKREREAQR